MSGLMIMAGGTGGHVYPALAVARELRRREIEVFWLGTRGGLEARIVPEAGFDIEWISIGGLKGKGMAAWVLGPFRIAMAMLQTIVVIFRRRPGAVLGMGGFVAGPGGLAAWLLRVPLLIHESNAVAGLTNIWLARIASQVLVGFPEVFAGHRRRHYVGNPVRPEIIALPDPVTRLAGRSGALRVLVVGGSLGAQVFNETLPQALQMIPVALRPEVRHQSGRDKLAATTAGYTRAGVEGELVEFIDDMAAAYAWADIVICRAGAMTVAELAAAGVAAILVPLPHAIYDHQTVNARHLADRQAAILQPQDGFTPVWLADCLQRLAADRARVQALAIAARTLAIDDATTRVADICREVLYA